MNIFSKICAPIVATKINFDVEKTIFFHFSAKWSTSNKEVSKFRSQAKMGSSVGNGNGKVEKLWTLCTVCRSSKFFLFDVSVFSGGAYFEVTFELANFL